jgi:mRNA interferase RelE/StbE
LYKLEFKKSVKKDLKNISKSQLLFIKESLETFVQNFNLKYEKELLKSGKIKKLQGQKETFYRLRLRTYSVIYQKKDDVLIILVFSIKSREDAYKK